MASNLSKISAPQSDPSRNPHTELLPIGRVFLNDRLIALEETSPGIFEELPSPQAFTYSPVSEEETQLWEWVNGDGTVAGHTAMVAEPTLLEPTDA